MTPTKAKKAAPKRFDNEDLSNAFFRNVNLSNARIRGALLTNADISGDITGLTVNGVEIAPLVQAELRRRNPELEQMSLRTPADALATWKLVEKLWASTMRKAAKLPERTLHKRVDDEWSFVETLRHLVFATDAWCGRAILNQSGNFWAQGMPFDELSDDDAKACGVNKRARPTLEKVMVARKDRQRAVRKLIVGLTPAELDRHCDPNPARGFPANPERFTVRQCLGVIVNEEWLHRSFANRDLAALAAQ